MASFAGFNGISASPFEMPSESSAGTKRPREYDSKSSTNRSKYKCSVCGQPKKGHVCHGQRSGHSFWQGVASDGPQTDTLYPDTSASNRQNLVQKLQERLGRRTEETNAPPPNTSYYSAQSVSGYPSQSVQTSQQNVQAYEPAGHFQDAMMHSEVDSNFDQHFSEVFIGTDSSAIGPAAAPPPARGEPNRTMGDDNGSGGGVGRGRDSGAAWGAGAGAYASPGGASRSSSGRSGEESTTPKWPCPPLRIADDPLPSPQPPPSAAASAHNSGPTYSFTHGLLPAAGRNFGTGGAGAAASFSPAPWPLNWVANSPGVGGPLVGTPGGGAGVGRQAQTFDLLRPSPLCGTPGRFPFSAATPRSSAAAGGWGMGDAWGGVVGGGTPGTSGSAGVHGAWGVIHRTPSANGVTPKLPPPAGGPLLPAPFGPAAAVGAAGEW